MNDKPVPPTSRASMAFYEITEKLKRDAAASCKAADDAMSASQKLVNKKHAKGVMNGPEPTVSAKELSEWVKEVVTSAPKQRATTTSEGMPPKPPDTKAE